MKKNDDLLLNRYKRLLEISRDLASTLDLETLLGRIVAAARDLTESEAASILLYDATARKLFFEVATNMDPVMQGILVPMDSIAGWILINRKPVRISDVSKDRRHFSKVGQKLSMDTRSLIGVPLVTKNKVIGVLEVINRTVDEYTEADEDLLVTIGAQAAVAIENTRLFQQSDLISEFVHELRTPLASLSTATYLLLRPEISREQGQQIITNINQETTRLSALATAFLDFARLESGRAQFTKMRFTLPKAVQECITTMQAKAQEGGISVEVIIPEDMPEVLADRNKIKQVVLNLLSNAIKYNRPNGTVTIEAGFNETNWQLKVADSGVGIPQEAIPNLFQKFYRVKGMETQVGGTGLGLSICEGIVQGHHGYIRVSSKPGAGTTFTVTIPRKQN